MIAAQAIQKEISQLTLRGVSLQQQQIAQTHLFNAAAIMLDGNMMDSHRASIHAVVDEILDGNARMFALTRQLNAL